MIDRVQGYYGFTRVPFGRDLAPSMLHQHNSTAKPRPASRGASTTGRSAS
ncbi:hypothetical protein [Streptomyces sp. NPDC002324]